MSEQLSGQDITNLFTRQASDFPACVDLEGAFAKGNPCGEARQPSTPGTARSNCPLPEPTDETFTKLNIQNTSVQIGYDWDQVSSLYGYIVVDEVVLNFAPYLDLHPDPISNDQVDLAIRQAAGVNSTLGKDATRLFLNTKATERAVKCLQQRYMAGKISKTSPGCVFAAILLYATLIVIMSIILIRFGLACLYAWFIAPAMHKTAPGSYHTTGVGPALDYSSTATKHVSHGDGEPSWPGGTIKRPKNLVRRSTDGTTKSDFDEYTLQPPVIPLTKVGSDLFTLCLVTCYSEGEESLRGTIDSISNTDYPESRKLLFVVCDGMITGSGESKSTPDICIGLLEADKRFGDPQPMGYIAVGVGSKRENQAKVYAGHYSELTFAPFVLMS